MVGRRFSQGESVVDSWLSARESPHTLRAYRGAVEAFASWAGEGSPGHAAQAMFRMTRGEARALVMRWRADMLDRGVAPATINLRIGALRSLVAYACDLGAVGWTLRIVDLMGGPTRDTSGPSRESVQKLIAWLGTRKGAKAARDMALVRLLYDMALRVSEACGIDLAGVKLDRQPATVRVRAKGRHAPDELALPPPTRAAIEAWISWRGDWSGPLLVSSGRKRLLARSAYNIVKRCGAVSGIGRLTPHGLRHSAITYALEATGGDVSKVVQFSRHRKLQTLLIYDDRRRAEAATVARMVAMGGRPIEKP